MKFLTLLIASVLLFGLIAVGVQAGAIGKTSKDITLGKLGITKSALQAKGIDNIDYTMQCDDQCTVTLNKQGVFQNRQITFDTTYQVLIKDAVHEDAVLGKEGNTITEAIDEPAVYETRNYTTLELEGIASVKIDAEIGSVLGSMTQVPVVNSVKKVDEEGKVKV